MFLCPILNIIQIVPSRCFQVKESLLQQQTFLLPFLFAIKEQQCCDRGKHGFNFCVCFERWQKTLDHEEKKQGRVEGGQKKGQIVFAFGCLSSSGGPNTLAEKWMGGGVCICVCVCVFLYVHTLQVTRNSELLREIKALSVGIFEKSISKEGFQQGLYLGVISECTHCLML